LSAPLPDPLAVPPVQPIDQDLDPVQRQAVSQALHTPDLALIQGLPGTGRSRVAAEIVRQSVARGDRVALVAPQGATVDRVLERLLTDPLVRPLRCLAPDENSADLAPPVRALTARGVLQAVEQQALPAAREKVERAEQHARRLEQDEGLWARFPELIARLEGLARQLADLERTQADLAETIESELTFDPATCRGKQPTGLQQQWQERVRLRDATSSRLQAREQELQAGLDRLAGEKRLLEGEQTRLVPLAEAKQQKRWWTLAWWKATLQSGKLQRLEVVRQRLTGIEQERTQLERERVRVRAEHDQAEAACRAERSSVTQAELQRRLDELNQQKTRIEEERRSAGQDWDQTLAALSDPALSPAERSPEAVERSRQRWVAQREAVQRELAVDRQWAEALEQALPGLADHLADWANVLVGTPAGLAAALSPDRLPPAEGSLQLDLLLLDDAHLFSDAEWNTFSTWAARCVALGEPPVASEEAGLMRRPGPAGRGAVRSVVVRPGMFQQLWQRLHSDPTSLPSRWREEGEQRICQLRPVSPDQEPWIETEEVVDRAEIELRIVAPPRTDPHIAEVIFPNHWGWKEAREFIYHELEELTVQPAGRALFWSETPERISLDFLPGTCVETVSATLDRGLHEVVASRPLTGEGPPCCTMALHFDRAAGWDRESAQRWVAERLHLRELGRTTLLTTPYRPVPNLARCLAEVLFPQAHWLRSAAYVTPGWAAGLATPPVEFVPATSAGRPEASAPDTRANGAGTAPAGHARPIRGAGLEVDLGDRRRREHLEQELKSPLPPTGLCNPAEARVVVRLLEELVRDAGFLAAWSGWQATHPAGQPLAIAVMALFPAQVELLRLLILQSEVLGSGQPALEVGLPSAFQGRECLVAVLSLTRSHTHRAVPFSDHPRSFGLALTRAAARVLVVGDAGTMLRRTQWQGALDHLDDSAGRREQALIGHFISHLIERLPEPSVPPRTSRLTESSRV
jgi:hypothetical protein